MSNPDTELIELLQLLEQFETLDEIDPFILDGVFDPDGEEFYETASNESQTLVNSIVFKANNLLHSKDDAINDRMEEELRKYNFNLVSEILPEVGITVMLSTKKCKIVI